ncbi:apolipoprotein N-acyltransferase, partial [Campylobacter coli]|nr:apolipoprotein N-acyltransferase [Campylobacter coli]
IITNAICYEATKEQNYKNSKIIIAISNNAWFNYSSEYKLQKLLMQFYASKYGVSVYHATNGKESGVIKPKEKFVQKIKNYFNKQDKS